MRRLLRSETYRLRRRWMPWALIAIVAGIVIAFYALLYFSGTTQLRLLRSGELGANAGPAGVEASIKQIEETLNGLRPSNVHVFATSVVGGIGAVMLIVFTASHMGTEYVWGTLRTQLAHGAGRGQLLATKLATSAAYAVVFLTSGILAAVIASYAISTYAGYDTSGFDFGKLGSATGRSGYTYLPYMALATVIALWARSSGGGIAIGLIVYFAENIVGGILISVNRDLAAIVNLGLARNASALTRVTTSTGASPSGAPALPDQTQAAIVLAAWTVLFVVLALWRLRSRDVTLA